MLNAWLGKQFTNSFLFTEKERKHLPLQYNLQAIGIHLNYFFSLINNRNIRLNIENKVTVQDYFKLSQDALFE